MADHEALAEEISINLNTLMKLAYSCMKYFDDETEYNIFELCNLYFRYGGSSFSMARVISSISSNFNTQQELDEVRTHDLIDWRKDVKGHIFMQSHLIGAMSGEFRERKSDVAISGSIPAAYWEGEAKNSKLSKFDPVIVTNTP